MHSDFYTSFEERFYASPQVIKEMRKQYLPFVDVVRSLYPGGATYDLGCGRGEWLELMLEHEFKAFGVDLDDGMLQFCHEKKLPAQLGDAVEYLTTLGDETQVIVSAFHVAEHLRFDQLYAVISESIRVLKPGGLLIVETPNPENIAVSTCNFYLDPTHQRPIPPEFLLFLAEHCGFARTQVLRLQESKELVNAQPISFKTVFSGASPDYAIVAQKEAPGAVLSLFDKEFDAEYGLPGAALIEQFDKRLVEMEEMAVIAHEKARRNEIVLSEMQNRFCWRITKPLRSTGAFLRRFSDKAKRVIPSDRSLRQLCINCILHLKLYIAARPMLKKLVLYCLVPFPRLKNRLRTLEPGASAALHQNEWFKIEGPEPLAPHARKIYNELKTRLAKHDQGRS